MLARKTYSPILLLLMLAPAYAQQSPRPRNPILNDVGIDQNLGAQVSPDLPFRDELGREVHLRDYFGNKPIVLALVYYKCPNLCTLVLNDMTKAMNAMQMTCGRDFEIVTISFDPRETPDLALDKKKQYLRAYRRPEAESGWHFLTGDQASIDSVTHTVGFRYAWDPKYQQYAHASGIVVLTPEGKAARYFYGLDYSPGELERSLAEASRGQSSRVSIADQLLLFCFHYDPTTGRYSLAILRLVQIFGALTVLLLAGYVLLSLWRERMRSRIAPG